MQNLFKETIKEVISPQMKSLEFAKSGNNFLKQKDGFQKTMVVQSSQWNNSEKVSFTIECGFFFLDLYSKIFQEKDLPKFPQPVHCLHQFRKKIDQIRNKGPQWYELDSTTEIDKLEKEIKWDIEWYIRKHFDQYRELHNFMVR